MKQLIFGLILTLSTNISIAQEMLWANKVLEKSSEFSEDFSPKYKAIQILGKPNVLPQTISSPCSWRPSGSNYGEDYIKVSFLKAIKIRQIIVGETVNPGAIARIFGYNSKNQEILLYENTGNSPKTNGGALIVLINETTEEINAIKLLIVHSMAKGQKEYDCIGISNSADPFVAKINLAENIPTDLEKENIGTNINSKFGEVAPNVSPDGKFLYFTRLNHPNNMVEKGSKNSEIAQDVWVSRMQKNGMWDNAVNLGEPINNSYDNAAATISADGRSLFLLNLYLPNGKKSAGLSKSTKRLNKWEFPKQINIDDFQALEVYIEAKKINRIETEYSISGDEKIWVMALKRNETFGDKDLYVSFKKSENNYGKPINIGSVINSAGNEGSPFLAADNKTLYFNSNGHPGYGEADIYVTTRLDDTWKNWSEPLNLGKVINSPEFDGFITIPASGEYAYFSSLKNSIGSDDIFRVKLFPSIKPQIVSMFDFQFRDKSSGKIIVPKIEFQKINDKIEKAEYSFDEETNEFKSILNVGNRYKLTASLDKYAEFSETLDLSKEKKYKEIKVVYDLMPLTTGERVIINNLFFDQSLANIKEESIPELERIKKLMVDHPTMEILLEGFTDNQGDMLKNIKLAEDRVKAVKEYIIKDSGVDPKRIAIKSWGPYKPRSTNATEEERKKNRRVEFTITKM